MGGSSRARRDARRALASYLDIYIMWVGAAAIDAERERERDHLPSIGCMNKAKTRQKKKSG